MPKAPSDRGTTFLPAARAGGVTLDAAIQRRRSLRELGGPPLTEAELGQLLWAAQGVTGPDGLRAAPSAGATYPLELYVATATGLHHYDPAPHRLVTLATGDLRRALYEAALYQEMVVEAPAVFVFTGFLQRTAGQYGAARAARYVWLEAGHAAQNLLLEAVALGLGAVPIAAFHDAEVRAALRCAAGEEPLYLVAVGHPRAG